MIKPIASLFGKSIIARLLAPTQKRHEVPKEDAFVVDGAFNYGWIGLPTASATNGVQ